jgi:hypothetical protein
MKKFLPLIALAGLLSCSKDIDTHAKLQNMNPTDYILTKATNTSNTNGETNYFYYNSDKLVSGIMQCNWGMSSLNNGPWQTWYDTTDYTFEYTDGLLTKKTEHLHRRFLYFFTYEYNQLNQLVKMSVLNSDNSLQKYYQYYYDGNGNMIRREHRSPDLSFTDHYTYDQNNNLISEETVSKPGPYQTKYKTEWITFDNKVNYTRAVNGLPYWDHMSVSTLSPNNPISQRHYQSQKSTDPYGVPDPILSSTYTYNAAGLPTKIISGNWTVDLEYQKYK